MEPFWFSKHAWDLLEFKMFSSIIGLCTNNGTCMGFKLYSFLGRRVPIVKQRLPESIFHLFLLILKLKN